MEERISKLEDKSLEMIQEEERTKILKKWIQPITIIRLQQKS